MKTKNLALLCCLFLLTLTAFGEDTGRSFEREKTITKTFSVSKATELKINNQFGNIVIVEWNKNEIDFSIRITSSSNVESLTQEQIDGINVKFDASANHVSAETTIKNVKGHYQNKSMQIDYTVKVPSHVLLKLNNSYGNVILNRTDKPFYANVKFGNLQADAILNEQSQIEVQYGDAGIGEAGKLNAKIDFGNIDLVKADGLVLASSYSKIRLGKINELIVRSQFDNSYNIGEVNKVVFQQADYTGITIGRLGIALKAHMTFSKLQIKETSDKLQEIIIATSYSDINIKLTPPLAFTVDLSMAYGNIELGKGINRSDINYEKSEYGDSVTATGKVGVNPQASIRITNSFNYIKLDM